ncbi:MAG: FHA domain-containing protein [Phycisphaerae bacterium]
MTASLLPAPRIAIRLVACDRNTRRRVRELLHDMTIFGSGDGSDVILASSRIARVQTVIVKHPNGGIVCDLAGGGTTLNGESVRWKWLHDGDRLGIGPFSFRVELTIQGAPANATIPVFSLRNEQTIGTVTSDNPVFLLGQAADCDVVLDHKRVQPRHCLLAWTREGAIVRDLSGRKMTRMNGQRIRLGRLMNGDAIGAGPFELLFETDETPTTRVLDARSDRVPLAGQCGPSEHVAGRFPHRLEPDITVLRMDTQSNGSSVNQNTDSSPKSPVGNESKAQMTPKKIETKKPNGSPPPSSIRVSDSARSRQLAWKADRLRSRVVAAQQALDKRAERHQAELAEERRRISSRVNDLQHQAHALLSAARAKHSPLTAQAEWLVRSLADLSGVEAAPVGDHHDEASRRVATPVEPVKSADCRDTATDRSVDKGSDGATADSEATPKFDSRVAELVRMAQMERREIERNEARLESLIFETERQQSLMNRRQADLTRRETELEARFKSLADSLVALHREREPLLKRLGEINAEEDSVRSRIQDCEQAREQMGADTEAMDQWSSELAIRRRDLLDQLEHERERVQARRAELHQRTAALEQAVLARKLEIEAEVTQHHAEIESREAELKARREEIESAAREEMERTAIELERVLDTRIDEIDAEMASHQEELGARAAGLCGIEAESNEGGKGEIDISIDEPLRKMAEELSALSRVDSLPRRESTGINELDAAIDAIKDEAAEPAQDRVGMETRAPDQNDTRAKNKRDRSTGQTEDARQSGDDARD